MINTLLKEYNLSAHDVRRYLAHNMTLKLREFLNNDPKLLTKYIASGKLEEELYDMVDRYLEDLKNDYQQGLLDESYIRESFQEMDLLKKTYPF